MDSAWKKILSKIYFKEKNDEFVLEQIYRGLPENRALFRQFCYVPGETFQVYIHQSALKKAYDHAVNGLRKSKEVAGGLIGRHLFDRQRNVEFVEILEVVQAQSGESTSVDVDISATEWGRIQAFIEDSTNYRIVGWYHSHPQMRAFMSVVDKNTQLNHFNHNGQVAIVIGVGSGISEIKCFDHFSNEVNLYFFPQENDAKLIMANLEFSQKSSPRFLQNLIKPVKYNISSLNKVFDSIFRKYELDGNINLLGFDSPKGHIQGFDRLYPELRLGIEYYIGFEDDDTLVLRAFKNEFMFFAINTNELDVNKVIDIVQVIYSSIFDYTKDHDAFYEVYQEVLREFEIALEHLRK